MDEKLQRFKELIEKERLEYMTQFSKGYLTPEQIPEIHGKSSIYVNIIPGKKYTKVDIGSSGKYMVDENGNIFGIKAYGVVHRGHHYGTLDTIHDWYWGDYSPEKR
jgi:hypothetical protein